MKTTVELSEMCRYSEEMWCEFLHPCIECRKILNCNMRIIAFEMILDGEY